MTIFAYYTPQLASPINQKRAGTLRIGSDTPMPILINKGTANKLIFSFRDENQKAVWVEGKTITAKIMNTENVELLSKSIKLIPNEIGLGYINLTKLEVDPWQPTLYNLIITYLDDHGDEYIVHTTHSLPRFVLKVENLL